MRPKKCNDKEFIVKNYHSMRKTRNAFNIRSSQKFDCTRV